MHSNWSSLGCGSLLGGTNDILGAGGMGQVLVVRNNDDMIDLDMGEVLSICFSDGTTQSPRQDPFIQEQSHSKCAKIGVTSHAIMMQLQNRLELILWLSVQTLYRG